MMPRHHRTSSEAVPRQQQQQQQQQRNVSSHSRSSSYHLATYAPPAQLPIPVAPNYYTIPPANDYYGQPTPAADEEDDEDVSHHNGGNDIPSRPSSGAWTAADDQQLIAARQHGLNWKQIRNTYFPSKSPNACRKRHERLLEKRDPDEWTQSRMHNLAKEYMSMRKEIWAPLAARTGEKWNVVEQRCMSSGLKNLQSAARAASRLERYRNAAAADRHGSGSDSGVSGIGLTPVDELDPNAQYSSPSISPSANQSFASNAQQQAAYVQQQQQLAAMQATHYRGSSFADMTAMYAAYASHPTYTSSASSSASNLAHPYVSRDGRSSQGSSPYMEETMDARAAGRI